jgi:hypothetical protein
VVYKIGGAIPEETTPLILCRADSTSAGNICSTARYPRWRLAIYRPSTTLLAAPSGSLIFIKVPSFPHERLRTASFHSPTNDEISRINADCLHTHVSVETPWRADRSTSHLRGETVLGLRISAILRMTCPGNALSILQSRGQGCCIMKLARADGLWCALATRGGEASTRAIKRKFIAPVWPDQVRGRDAQSPRSATQ